MKTRTTNQKLILTNGILVMMVILVSLSAEASAQDQDSIKSVFGSNVKVSEIWTPEVQQREEAQNGLISEAFKYIFNIGI